MTKIQKYLEDGKIVESNFAIAFCLQTGISMESIKFATKEEDISEHWDISYLGIKVDVKGLRKLYRNDPAPDPNYHWIEFKNVRGAAGWLYGSADLFAFELDNSYLCVQRAILQKFIESKCKDKILMRNREPYTIYRRYGRNDILTIARSLDLAQISDFIIKKI